MIELEDHGAVRVIALNRPEVKNAFNGALYCAVCDALDEAARCDDVDVVVITARGPYFSSGADLKAAEPPDRPTAEMPVGRFMQTLMRFPKMVIAAVNGPAVGVGATMLPHCDIAVAAEGATFWTPFARVALVPEFCSSMLFARIMGPSMAADMIMAGRKLTAREALARGLVSRVVPDGEALAAAISLAQEALRVPLARRSLPLFKRMMRQGDVGRLYQVFREEMERLDERLANGEAADAVVQLLSARARL